MKKIAILTLNGNFNYGNKLQNYALLKYLESKGFNVETIWYKDNIKTRIKNEIKRLFPYKLSYKRTNCFENFTRKYLNRKYYKKNDYSNLYDFIIVGSDQVWNYNLNTFDEKYFLGFSENKNKNMAYSASFGIPNIDEEMKEVFKNGLNNFNYISVREESGKRIIKELINKDVEVLVDPTLLLTTNEWDKIARKPKQLKNNRKYILNYFLGDISNDRKKVIEDFASKNDCEIINIHDINNEYYAIGPEEFVYLEKNAFLICTDSFHSVIFSILYRKPFIVFDRIETGTEGMETRIESLLNKFGLNDRKFNNKIDNDILNCDYSNIEKILYEEKKKSDDFLNKALN